LCTTKTLLLRFDLAIAGSFSFLFSKKAQLVTLSQQEA